MSLWQIAWNYLWDRKLTTVLTIFSVALAVGLISAILTIRDETRKRFEEEQAAFDVVVGPNASSSLQLILSSIYFLDSATGTMSWEDYETVLNYDTIYDDEVVANAFPIALGDTYRQHRIVGTERKLFDYEWMSVQGRKRNPFVIAEGDFFDGPMQAVIGAEAAKATGLAFGDKFEGTHGSMDLGSLADYDHSDTPFTVVGVLKPSGTSNDRAIFVDIESVWNLHDHDDDHHDDDHHDDDHHDDDTEGHDGEYSAHTEDAHAEHDDDDEHIEDSEAREEDPEGHSEHEDEDSGHTEDAHAEHDDDDEHIEESEAHEEDVEGHSDHEDEDSGHTEVGHVEDDDDDAHDDHLGEGDDHDAAHAGEHADHDDRGAGKEVSAVLVDLVSPAQRFSFLGWARNDLKRSAAIPYNEILLLYTRVLQPAVVVMIAVGYVVVVISALSIMIGLYLSIIQRKRDLAIMRALGAAASEIFGAVIIEAFLVTVMGIASGWVLGKTVALGMGAYLSRSYGLGVHSISTSPQELGFFGIVGVVGLLAGILPAWQAYRTDVAKDLTAS